MDKDILKHKELILKKIILYKENGVENTDIKSTYNFHITRVRDFQHERFIHLLVTLFFAGLLLLSILGLVLISSLLSNQAETNTLTFLIGVIATILFVTELFYIRHYFQLENGTQALYSLTKQLHGLLESQDLESSKHDSLE